MFLAPYTFWVWLYDRLTRKINCLYAGKSPGRLFVGCFLSYTSAVLILNHCVPECDVGGSTCHRGSPFIAALLHMKWSFHVQIQLCRLAQNSGGMRCSSFYWMHKFRKSKHRPTVLAHPGRVLSEHATKCKRALSQSHSSVMGWYLCQCGPLRWNYCHSWQEDSLQVIKEVLIQKHLAAYWAPDRFWLSPTLTRIYQTTDSLCLGPGVSLVSSRCEVQLACCENMDFRGCNSGES